MTRAKWLAIAAGAIVLAGTAAWAFHTTPEMQVQSAPVTLGTITRRVVASGTVQPLTTVEVGSQVSGNVKSLEADFNSVAHAGQVIAHLDPEIYALQLQQAQAAGEAEANAAGFDAAVESAQQSLTRAEALAAEQLLDGADLDAARIAMDEARADARDGVAAVAQAKAAVGQAQTSLDQTIIRSPIDGVVVARNVDVGQTMAASFDAPVLFSIASDLTHLQVQVDIDEANVGGLMPGEPVTFEVESYPDETFSGTLTQVRLQPVAQQTTTATTVATSTGAASSSVVPTVVTYPAVVSVESPGERLRPGMTAEVTLVGSQRENAIRVPNSAFAFHPPSAVLHALGEKEPSVAATNDDDGGARAPDVWTYDGKRFTPVAVHVGLAAGAWTELLGGAIRPGDRLVTSVALRQRSKI
jgi:HlyD family secretion protein